LEGEKEIKKEEKYEERYIMKQTGKNQRIKTKPIRRKINTKEIP
jgi:hypothetical protein